MNSSVYSPNATLNSAQSMQRPTPRGQSRNIWNSSSCGPNGNWRNECLISAVGPKEDVALLRFFETGAAVFLLRGFDMIYLQEELLLYLDECKRYQRFKKESTMN
ncbi:hypothetical protein GOBAR_AA05184 [Gossypium barbadense]|uniref:Uncharacterized protein n=1 Tax=Gossypium barbadense TaxID=3634 RepID=A0A2P5YII7_GOSBA|nr:hypothetical protein GOBAR_AA05184 [Gossypium barbadense]